MLSIDLTETCAYGTSKDQVSEKKKKKEKKKRLNVTIQWNDTKND